MSMKDFSKTTNVPDQPNEAGLWLADGCWVFNSDQMLFLEAKTPTLPGYIYEIDVQQHIETAAKVAKMLNRVGPMWELLKTLAETMKCNFKIPCLGGASTLCPVCDAKYFVQKFLHEFEVGNTVEKTFSPQ